jgi:hypothetical protein
MKVSDIPLHHLRIGQVVRFEDGELGFVCMLAAAMHFFDPNDTRKARLGIIGGSEIYYFTSVGRLRAGSPSKEWSDYVALSRVLLEEEFSRFAEIIARESEQWQPLTSAAFGEANSWVGNLLRRAAEDSDLSEFPYATYVAPSS